ncbi:unnamed protein product [Notodromas monacha]|uniref:Uncharacterized protein n=1 Tax=Notodromas monacha TaxID=399045 RepID=A0A7R9GDL1_9CRUS|nr:unnamed protein product [Notodromas monacha]CAG0917015.1 unnamed protein product [Notodromas monacha]
MKVTAVLLFMAVILAALISSAMSNPYSYYRNQIRGNSGGRRREPYALPGELKEDVPLRYPYAIERPDKDDQTFFVPV